MDSEETDLVTCERCGNDTDELHTFNNDEICDSCHDDTTTCYECRDDIYCDDARSHDREDYCEGCYDDLPRCENCNEVDDDLREINCTSYCDSCVSDNFSWCDVCDDYVRDDDYAGDSRCTDHSTCSEYVQSYNTNVLNTHSKDKGNRLFGVELEVATEDDLAEAAEAVHYLVNSDAILKEDSSISNCDYEGFEIVTRPMTLANQLDFWAKFLDRKPDDLRSYDVETCGLHIHVSRKSVSQLTIGKLLVFLNDPKHEALIKRIAQRYNNGYAQAKVKKLTDCKHKGNRYEMLNLLPANTIEFRLFRGTLNRNRLLACIEFTAVLIEFCETHSHQHITEKAFRAFVEKMPKNKHLKTILNIDAEDNQKCA